MAKRYATTKQSTTKPQFMAALCIFMTKENSKVAGYQKLTIGAGVGLLLTFFGALSGGAGHGPYPILSAKVMISGLVLLAFCVFALVIYAILPKKIFEYTSVSRPPKYPWACPKCGQHNRELEAECDGCGYHT